MADFFERTKELEHMVGDGDLKGEFAVEKARKGDECPY